jgi:hypothetical protein
VNKPALLPLVIAFVLFQRFWNSGLLADPSSSLALWA